MFTQPDSRSRATALMAPQQTPPPAFQAAQGRTSAPKGDAATTSQRAEQMSPRAELQNAEHWAGDCLFDYYND